jgi:hypothetical protein
MNRFPKRSKTTDLDEALRRFRPRPSTDLVHSIKGQPRRDRQQFARFGAALAAAGLVLVALGAGGAGYAYSSGSTSAQKSSGIHLNQTGVINRPSSSSDVQYGPVTVPPYPPTTTPASPPPSSGGTSGGGSGGTSGGGGTSGVGQSSGQPSGTSTGASGTPTVAGGGATKVSSSGNLPFTGMSLAFPFLLGAVLVVLGLALRRKARAKA